ncbi:MAG: hypothetical protein D6815_04380, partial [Candidatus Dadabacteria bacterium]
MTTERITSGNLVRANLRRCGQRVRLVVAAALLAAAPASAAVICVPDMAVDPSCTASQPSIASAISAANPAGGDTVLVGPGLYVEAPVIDRPLTLRAAVLASEANAGNPAAQAIIDGGGALYVVSVASGVSGVTIEGFEITNPTYSAPDNDPAGIRIQSDDALGPTVTAHVRNNVIHDIADPGRTSAAFGETGISAFNIGGGSTISGNTIYNLSDSEPPSSPGESPGSGRAQAILVKSSNGTASGVTIDGNVIHDVQDVGIRFNGVSGSTAADVTNNVIYAIGSAGTGFLSGIGIDHIGQGNVAGNLIDTVIGGFGLGVQASGTTAVTGNRITRVTGGNDPTFPGAAILVNSDGTTVEDNYLFINALGVVVGATVASAGQVTGNCITGNAAGGLVNGSAATVDATGNWWGCAAGPGSPGCDTVADLGGGSTTFAPVATTPVCSGCGTTRYVATGGNDLANLCENSGNPCATVQHGVDVACVGETVEVAAGTYQEQVRIDKSLTLAGAGAGVTTILAPPKADRAIEAADHGFGLRNYDYLVGVFGHGQETVVVSGFTLDGNFDAKSSGPGTFRSQQLTFLNASGTIENNELLNWQDPAAFGVQGVASLVVGSATPTAVVVRNNVVSGYQKAGIVAFGTGAVDVTIEGNTVTGAGPISTTAQNGIQISNGATGRIVGNTVTGNDYTPMTWCASGILVYLVDGIEVRGNTLSANLCDLFVQSNGNTVTGNSITASSAWPFTLLGNGNIADKNYVDGAPGEGIYVDGTGNVLTCNRLTNNGTGVFIDAVSSSGTPNNVNENVIQGNGTGLDASAVTSLPLVDGTLNYWGCPTGPNTSGCDTAVGNVDVTPFATSEPLCVTCAGAGGDTDGDEV